MLALKRLSDLWWQRTSIRTKMHVSLLAFSMLMLLIAAFSLLLTARAYFDHKTRQDLTMLGRVLAENSAAAVVFEDRESALKLLTSLRSYTSIDAAALYPAEQAEPLAAWPADHAVPADLLPSGVDELVQLRDEHYLTRMPISVSGQHIGALILVSNLREWHILKRRILNLLLVMALGFAILTVLVSYWMKRHIIRPVLLLADWAMQVSRHKNFNSQAPKRNEDEIGHLADSLNVMLDELAKQQGIVSLNATLEREIQERKEVEQDLINTRNQAEEASRAKSRFLANMSHELRTPLNAIIGYSEMIQEMVSENDFDTAELIDDTGKINSAGRHLLSLINDILDISKIEAGKMQLSIEAFNLDALVEDVISTLKPLADARSNQLRIQYSEPAGTVQGDPVKLRQVLFNLVSNAVKFTEAGRVEVHYGREQQGSENLIVFKVRDTGIGMNPEGIKELFQPFSQADASTTRRFGGTGLGLAISRSYVTMLNGTISVTSQEGKGSEFVVTLPVEYEVAYALNPDQDVLTERQIQASGQPAGQEVAGCHTPILLIDDDPDVHDLLSHSLGKNGFQIRSAYSGEEGLALIREQRPAVIVLDIGMPTLNGWQVLQKVKDDPATADIPVVMYTVDSDREKGFALGAADYLLKPVRNAQLIETLQRFRVPENPHLVLSIDDDPHSQTLIRAYLRNTQWQLETAGNGRQGLEYLEQHQNVAVILLDLVMPEMNGFEFLEACRANPATAGIPVVIISARDLTPEEQTILLRHSQAIIRKGMYDRDTLVHHINTMLLKYRESCTAEDK